MAFPVYLLILSLFFVPMFCNTLFSNEQDEDYFKAAKVNNGVYDCVDFFKQPAFSNPLLKNHTSEAITNLAKFHGRKINGIGGGACPFGTVPILRDHPLDFSNGVDQHVSEVKPQAHCVAFVHTNNLSWKLFGAGGQPTIYKPDVKVNQWSSARIKVSNGNENVEAGWMINPSHYKDNEAHLYINFVGTTKLKQPGFVQVSRNVGLGAKPDAYSEFGKTQRFWNITLKKDQGDGNWWLLFGTPIEEPIGYLPKEYFTTLADHANQAEWGGEIDNPAATWPMPQMGNGYMPTTTYDYHESAAVVQATIIDDKYNIVTPGEDTHKTWDCEDFYIVKDADYKGKTFGRLILYGGPNDEL